MAGSAVARTPGRNKKFEREIDRVVAGVPIGFTVLIGNSMTGVARYVGSFETDQEAADYADREAGRSRSFVSFEIWTGSPRNPGRPVRGVGSGRA